MNSKSNSLSHSPESLGQLTDDHLSARSSHAISWCNDDVLCVAQQLCSLWHVDNDRVWKHFFLRVGIARLLDLHSRTLEWENKNKLIRRKDERTPDAKKGENRKKKKQAERRSIITTARKKREREKVASWEGKREGKTQERFKKKYQKQILACKEWILKTRDTPLVAWGQAHEGYRGSSPGTWWTPE
jgi:hypothetical protein